MEKLKSYVYGQWIEGTGDGRTFVNPTTEEILGCTDTNGIDFKKTLEFARNDGSTALRELSFAQRGELLTALSKSIHAHREELIELGIQSAGNTRSDAKFDIDGASGTLAYYASVAKKLGEKRILADGDPDQLARSPRFVGQHVWTSRTGVAIHINAFNFPAWGLAEKAACAILAGMPVVSKPASSTALMTVRMVENFINEKVVPEGVLSLISGSVGDLLEHVRWDDVLAFTGSSGTGRTLRSHAKIIEQNIRMNIEADSLNSAILGADVDRDSETYDLFIAEVVRDMTQKAGQKCTAIRRVLVPKEQAGSVRDDLADRLGELRTGDPSQREVKIGPLATADQLRDAHAGLEALQSVSKAVVGNGGRDNLFGIDNDKGFFVTPTLLLANDSHAEALHAREVFAPVATLMPYDGTAGEATTIVAKGEGGLVSSVYSDDVKFVGAMVDGIGPCHGRLHLGSAKVAEHSPGPGTVLPQTLHGGPGRAGGGQELGGKRGMEFYMQRTALQGYSPLLEKLLA